MDGCHFSYITKLKGKKTRKKKRKEKEHLLELKCRTLFWMKKKSLWSLLHVVQIFMFMVFLMGK
jgi:hypothetical protein